MGGFFFGGLMSVSGEESPVVENTAQDVEAGTTAQEDKEDTQTNDFRNRQGARRREGGPPRNAERAAESTFGDLLDPFPQFADIPTMKSEFSYIAQYGQRSKNAAVKSNIGRLADISFDLLRKCEDLGREQDAFTMEEAVFEQLKNEYEETTGAYDALIQHLESLVKQLHKENDSLKKNLKANKIALPVRAE